jgi:hypothetical protein
MAMFDKKAASWNSDGGTAKTAVTYAMQTRPLPMLPMPGRKQLVS